MTEIDKTKLASTRSVARARGERFYYTGLPCRAGHDTVRLTRNGACRECRNAQQRRHWRKPGVKESRRRYLQKYSKTEKFKKRKYAWARAYRKGKGRKIYQLRQEFKRKKKSLSLHVKLLSRQDCKCALCKKDIFTVGPLEVDHIIPLSKGGTNKDDNLRIVCEQCHKERHRKK